MRMIFVNLPVADLQASTAFYTALGFNKNPDFSDDTASCMVVSEQIYVMLLTHDKFRMFINGDISDARKTKEVLNCLSASSRDEVDASRQRRLPQEVANGSRTWKWALCTAAASRTSTAMSGKSCIWTCPVGDPLAIAAHR